MENGTENGTAKNESTEKRVEFIICEVCGRSNPPDAGMCGYCSNLLLPRAGTDKRQRRTDQ